MKQLVRRLAILAMVAVVGGIGLLWWNGGTGTESVVYSEMASATLPTLSFLWKGQEIDVLHGYVEEMDSYYMQDAVLPLEEEGSLSILIHTYGQTVTGLSCELRTVQEGRLLERSTAELLQEEGELCVTLTLAQLLTEGEEYLLIFTLTTEEQGEIYYYSGAYYSTDSSALEQALSFALDFSSKTLDNTYASELAAYLETDTELDQTSLGCVTIQSTSNLLMWADLNPVRSSEVSVTLKRLGSRQISLTLEYEVTAEDEQGREQTYQISEFFCVRIMYGTIYLMSYERQMDQVLNVDTAVSEDSIDLGILSDSETEAVSNGDFTAFVSSGELWEYDASEETLICVFSFREEGDDGVRTLYGQHGFRILKLDEEGNLAFVVYGYMNRGADEGRCGLFFYQYSREDNSLTELFYIPSDRPYECIREDIEELFYVGGSEQIYFLYRGSLYSVDLVGNEPIELASSLTEGSYVISEEQDIIAWQDGSGEYGSEGICILYMEEGRSQWVQAAEGELVRVLGFLGDDFVYALVRESDESVSQSLRAICPAYALKILDSDGELQGQYEVSGYYISDITIANNRIRIERLTKADDGTYVSASEDSLLQTVDRETITTSCLVAETAELRLTIYTIQTAGAESADCVTPSLVNAGGATRVKLRGSETGVYYYGYGCGTLLYEGASLSDAIAAVYDASGYVRSSSGYLVWERAGLSDSASVSLVNPENAASQEDRLRAAVLTLLRQAGLEETIASLLEEGQSVQEVLETAGVGCVLVLDGASLQQILYYIQEGVPVLALTEGTKAELLIAYDSVSVTLYDSLTGSTYQMTRTEAEDYYAAYEDSFLCLLY